MSPDADYLDETSGKEDSVPSSSVSVHGGYQDSIFQDISAIQQEERLEIRPEFWAAPEETSPDSCVPDTLIGGSQPMREWDEVTLVADDTLDSVSEFSTYQNTGYYSASPVGTVASSNDTALDIEMSELMNLVTYDCSGSEQDATVVQRPSWTPASYPSPSVQTGVLEEREEIRNMRSSRSNAEVQHPLTNPAVNLTPPESPVMTVIETAGNWQEVAEETCEDEVTVMQADASSSGNTDVSDIKKRSFADSVAEITDDEECLEEIRVREELAEMLTEPTHLHAAKSSRKPEILDGVPLIALERKASLLEDIHEIDEGSLKDPLSEVNDLPLASISKAASATDTCLRLLERSPQTQAESHCSSISDIASLEDSIEREYNDQAQRIESLELGLGVEMACLERDLSLLKSLQKILDENGYQRSDCYYGTREQRNLVREVGGHGELYNDLYRRDGLERIQSIFPKFRAELKAFERTHQLKKHTAKRFYAEKTGSIFRIPSPSSTDSDSSENLQSCTLDYGYRTSGAAPKIISHLQNRHIQVGCRIKLSCAIDGDPCPEITWFRNGRPLTIKNRHFIVSMVSS
ncbi:hypothetical protein BIW11_03013 [Tropilaelaps mercedesae]|uniref:Ig-like domain-containing protein n=1 Tax=Tropilaelaps mercedesae TaxID=418985 RepID=A0A1V9XTL2_9ACAR|nr:hypothetical protein BIW11_03013 [Tropilaelaps mercedesae]